jgi:hypothetical protein
VRLIEEQPEINHTNSMDGRQMLCKSMPHCIAGWFRRLQGFLGNYVVANDRHICGTHDYPALAGLGLTLAAFHLTALVTTLVFAGDHGFVV